MEIKKGETDNITIKSKASISYDYNEDIFYAYPLDRKYKKSIMLDNFIIDLNKENKVVGIEILDYSKVLRIQKYYVQGIKKGKIVIAVNPEQITIEIMVEVVMRNKHRERLIDIQRNNDSAIAPSILTSVLA